jgi:hypothetical protein
MPWPLALTLTLAAAAGGPPPPAGAAEGRYESVRLTGTVIALTDALKSFGLAADPEPIGQQVVLKGDDGTITPLVCDTASRALFRDPRLRNRRTEIEGRRRKGLPYLQVVSLRIDDNGTMRTPEYFCEICKISVRFPQTCPCCQGPMELRMKPATR